MFASCELGDPYKSRGEWIRTTGLFVPNEALYQAEPRPECEGHCTGIVGHHQGQPEAQGAQGFGVVGRLGVNRGPGADRIRCNPVETDPWLNSETSGSTRPSAPVSTA